MRVEKLIRESRGLTWANDSFQRGKVKKSFSPRPLLYRHLVVFAR